MSSTIRVQFSGTDHSGKTNARILAARFFERLGAKVVLQACDEQMAEKMVKSDEDLARRLDGTTIVMTEMRTGV